MSTRINGPVDEKDELEGWGLRPPPKSIEEILSYHGCLPDFHDEDAPTQRARAYDSIAKEEEDF